MTKSKFSYFYQFTNFLIKKCIFIYHQEIKMAKTFTFVCVRENEAKKGVR